MDTRTDYDITMLIDWTPLGELPPHHGLVIWDVPENILDHLNDPLYQEYFSKIPVISVPNQQMRLAIMQLAAHKHVIILPTYVPMHDLQVGSTKRLEHSMGIFGENDISDEQAEMLSQFFDQHPTGGLVTDQKQIAERVVPSVCIDPSFQSYVRALHTVSCVIGYRTSMHIGDGFRVRDALALGLRAISNVDYLHEVEHHPRLMSVTTLRDTHLTPLQGYNNTEHIRQYEQFIREWSIHYRVDSWWKAWEKLIPHTKNPV